MRLRLSRSVLEETFALFRRCGDGQRECQAFWIGSWRTPDVVSEIIHPAHSATAASVAVDDAWMNDFWLLLAERGMGLRAQVHTHPGAAFHSATDDAFPVIASEGFLSLVIPRFAAGPVGFDQAFLARMDPIGFWREAAISDCLEVVP